MKHNPFSFANRLIVLALASLALTACGGDDGIDDLLSEETTPVMFEMPSIGYYYLFDYAGSHYVGSDTIIPKNQNTEVKLRQGKHHLIWIKGLGRFAGIYWDYEYGISASYGRISCIGFNPIAKSIETEGSFPVRYNDVKYAVCDVNVRECLLPTQKVKFSSITARVIIEVTDEPLNVKLDEEYDEDQSYNIGYIKGYPFITHVSLFDNNYKTSDTYVNSDCPINDYYIKTALPSVSPTESIVYSHSCYDVQQGRIVTEALIEDSQYILCPINGLDNIQLTAEVYDKDGNPISTTTLPKFNLRRGYTTILRGPLFSGSTSDWTVTMKQYDD